MIVVDVGCMAWPGKGRLAGGEESIYRLIARFEPAVLLGFDPHPLVEEGIEMHLTQAPVRKGVLAAKSVTMIVRRQALGWHEPNDELHRVVLETDSTHSPRESEGEVEFEADVPAVSIPDLIDCLPPPIVLKLDCEGCEYPILHEIRRRNLDLRLELVLVEWHDWIYPPTGKQVSHGWETFGKTDLRCPVEAWEE